jgi:hypothetical protein
MNRILFQISYDVHPEKREEYLTDIKELESYMKSNTNHDYMVVEDKNRKNFFTEVYVLKDEAEFEGLEDEMDDKIYGLTTKILSSYVVDGKTKYSTSYEIN